MTDQQLVESIKNGDDSAFEILYDKYFSLITSYVKQNNGNNQDAEDIFQETIIVFLQKTKNADFILTSSLSTYLFAISKNLWLKQLRNSKEVIESQLDESCDVIEINEDTTGDDETHVYSWLERITKHCQQILKAIFFYDQPIEKLMIKMGWKNKHTAANQKYKCIQQLKKEQKRDE